MSHSGMEDLFIGMRWGKVLAVRAGEARGQGTGAASQWVADLEDTHAGGGLVIEGAIVVSARRPRVHDDARPSYVLWGTMNGSIRTPWCIPVPWTACRLADIVAHELLDEYETLTVTLRVDAEGQTHYTIRTPEGDEHLHIVTDADGNGTSFEMLGGSRRMARAGDYVAIDAATSPGFAAWQTALTTAANTLAVLAGELVAGQAALAEGQAALFAQVAAIEAWGATVSPPLPALPPGPVPPTPPVTTAPADVPLPSDGVPAVDGSEPIAASPCTTVGQIVTGSTEVLGR